MKVSLPLRLALRDLRGGISSFKIFLSCLVLGVAAIAGIGSISSSIIAGLAADGRRLLGGDIAIKIAHRPASLDKIQWLKSHGKLARTTSMRSMANNPATKSRMLVNLKSVDGPYPLYGTLELTGEKNLKHALSYRKQAWGAAVEPRILEGLNI